MKYVDETDRAVTSAMRLLRVPSVRDVPEVVRELMGAPHPKLGHLRCVGIDLRVEVDGLNRTAGAEVEVFIRSARITARYEVPQ
jgi:hypothetical protein